MTYLKNTFILNVMITCFILGSCQPKNEIDWPVYLGNHHSSHLVDAYEITKDNVQGLQVAWTFNGGEADPNNRSQIQCNPLIIEGVLYGSTAKLKFIALDAATGELIWSYNPFGEEFKNFGMGVNRGLIYWESKDGSDKRLYFSAGPFLHCLDAENGKPVLSFGDQGKVSLKYGLDRDVEDRFILSNTPGIIFEDKIIIGTRVDETSGAAPGHIRAFNIHTGEREWIFHTIPQPGEYGIDTWPEDSWQNIGGANSWTGMSLDLERGYVFVPTGSASYDFYGGDRLGENLFANCVLALNARTGERVWHFQTIHHDIWDRDLPAPPNLATIKLDGKDKDVVIQITKMGFIYVLDRDTGEPIFSVNEEITPLQIFQVNKPGNRSQYQPKCRHLLDRNLPLKRLPTFRRNQTSMLKIFFQEHVMVIDFCPHLSREVWCFQVMTGAENGVVQLLMIQQAPCLSMPMRYPGYLPW